MTRDDDLADRLEADRRDLLDLTLRNPLLNYRPRVRGLELAGESPDALFRLLVLEGKALALQAIGAEPDANDPRLQTALGSEELQDRLLAIHHAARTAVEEQGVNTLFLAMGLLRWTGDVHHPGPFRAPLVLVPVDLLRSTVRDRFRVRHDGDDLDVNLSLAEKLRVEFGIALPPLPDPEEFDVSAYFDAVAEAVRRESDWSIERDSVAIGFFSFGKFLMYRDLDPAAWPEGSPPARHPIVQALLGDGFEGPPLEEEDDGPIDLGTVLDADRTQRLALRDAAAGRSLVIQGPPGTGKSQTIANLIAEAVGRGQTVLFVAEKLAALDVVKRRLDAIGLGEACLELHSHNASKKAVLDQLRRTLNAGRPDDAPEGPDPGLEAELRDRLDSYCDAINEPIGSSGVTPHQAIGELVRLRASLGGPPELACDGLEDWTVGDFRRRQELVERLQDRIAGLGGPREHLFFGCRRTDWRPGDEDRLLRRLGVARHASAMLREAASSLSGLLRLPPPDGPGGVSALVRSGRLVAELARWPGAAVPDWPARRGDVRALLEMGLRWSAIHDRHDPLIVATAYEEDHEPLRVALAGHGRPWWHWALPAYHRARFRLDAICKGPIPPRLDDQLRLLDDLAEARRLRQAIESARELGLSLFGDCWAGPKSDWPALRDLADGLDRIEAGVRSGDLPLALLEAVSEPIDPAVASALLAAVEATAEAHRRAVGRVVEFLKIDESARFGERGGLADQPFAEQEDLLNQWDREAARVGEVLEINRLAGRCREEGLGGVVALAESWPGASTQLADAFRGGWYEALRRRAFRERPILAEFDGRAHDRAIASFREADRHGQRRTRAEIARSHWSRVPRHSGGGQLAALRRELAKKARHLPVRQLMGRSGLAIQAAKPVFLMSPLSVAAYLPPGAIGFDLVVFDEASQVRPLDALGALLRGRRAVVVGDSRQLPPTTFFDRLTMGDEDDQDDEPTSEVESILGLFTAQGCPERMLRWHYRSRHESLIAVSNREFYDGRLVTFPSPDAGRRRSGLVFRHLPQTVYDRGRSRTNPGEADAVARAVLAFARRQLAKAPGDRLSLGVATFSAAQMRATLDRVERLRRDHPAAEPFFDPGATDPFFVKNLENVQGDERDVIFISVGYGRTAEGTVSYNFGPLNAEGGERRLNVLITRARVRCEVFSNLTANDLDPARIRSRGVQALRSFLEYAQNGQRAESNGEASPGPWAEAFRSVLEAGGYSVRGPIGGPGGRIDLGVFDPAEPGRMLVGIRGDGPAYQQDPAAIDRDRLRPEVLQTLGWRIVPAWSPDWQRDPVGRSAAILKELREAAADPPSQEPAPPTDEPAPQPDPVEVVAVDEPASLDDLGPTDDGFTPYRPHELAPDSSTQPDRLADRLAEVVRSEGPVHAAEVRRRLVEASGAKRLGPRLQEAIEQAEGLASASGTVERRGEFLWPPGLDRVEPRDRSGLPATARKLDLVPPEEIGEALIIAARRAFGIEPDALPAIAAKSLGFPRIGEDNRARIAEIVAGLVRDGRLVARGPYLIAPGPDGPVARLLGEGPGV